ncbi:MAG TPA: hypothetical protein VM884_07445 [Flavisolibacter sp.]|jgi:hypothetical protein|nr:hypothetical protein [Flavisolibacter sp.]
MATTTLKATVKGGKAPVTIRVRCFKNGKHFLDLSFPTSFSHTFTDLKKGEYSFFITGFNPKAADASTECSISEDEITLNPPDPSPIKSIGVAYLVAFHFTV